MIYVHMGTHTHEKCQRHYILEIFGDWKLKFDIYGILGQDEVRCLGLYREKR